MTQQTQTGSCVIGSIGLAAIAGIFATVVALMFGGLSWSGAIFLGILATAVLAVLFLIIFCKPLPALNSEDTNGKAAAASSSAPASAAVATAPASEARPTAKAKPAAKTPAAKAKAAPAAAKTATAKAPAAKKAAPAAKKTAAAAPAADGSVSDAFKPATLNKARAGGADDLKLIKGVGPKMEGVCNKLGFYHFDQVAAWSKDELTWVDANLEGFRGRASRDEWVAQAKILAAGGETEFSAKKTKK